MAGNTEQGGERPGNRWRRAIWGTAALLLLLPLLVMQFTKEVAWDAVDFALFGTQLVVACGGYELATRLTASTTGRVAAAVALVTAFLLVWINVAVGMIGSEDDPANLMFGGVLGVGIVGAFLGRLQPRGMARALAVTALAQALVGVIALVARFETPLHLHGGFVALWLVSAGLYRKAAGEPASAGVVAQVGRDLAPPAAGIR